MIYKNHKIELEKFSDALSMEKDLKKDLYKKAIFFDLEHYVYKVPICVGVFGCCYYNEDDNSLNVTQYMIEGKDDAKKILELSKEYFIKAKENHKEYIITFSGNNDFIMINYLFKKYGLEYNVCDNFIGIDLQTEYERIKRKGIGLKALEKEFGIERESELISGSNLAKTISKIIKDKEYVQRMPKEKIEKILLYNEQDVVSLFQMYINWRKVVNTEQE